MITGITTAHSIKVLVPLLGHQLEHELFFFWNYVLTLLSDANQHKDLIQESLVAENSYALLFSK